MNELAEERTPLVIAIEINNIKNETRKAVLLNSIAIGQKLVEAKQLVEHGQWGEWLESAVDYSQSTANNLMKIYEEYGSDQGVLFGGTAQSEAIANLPYTKALALMSIPNYEREEFIEENNVEEMSSRELQQAIKEKKELEEKLKVYEAEAEQYQNLKNQEAEYKEQIEELNQKLEEASNQSNESEIEELETAIKKHQEEKEEFTEKIKSLEADLKEKPKTIEIVPDGVREELEQLRAKANESQDELEFKTSFDTLIQSFNNTLETVKKVKSEENQSKYKNAISKLIEKMTSLLDE